jgi:hypothetical protein
VGKNVTKRSFWLLLLLLTACSQVESTPIPPVADTPAGQEEVATPTTLVATSEAQPTPAETIVAIATQEPEGSVVGVTNEPQAAATAESTPTAAAEQAEEVAFNGRNEDGTFFRGAADAPVTMFDYSDFL